MITKKQQIELWEEFKKLRSDEQRWNFIIKNQDCGIKINLDNDATFGSFEWDEYGDYLFQFDYYIGWSDGIITLLAVIGIWAEPV